MSLFGNNMNTGAMLTMFFDCASALQQILQDETHKISKFSSKTAQMMMKEMPRIAKETLINMKSYNYTLIFETTRENVTEFTSVYKWHLMIATYIAVVIYMTTLFGKLKQQRVYLANERARLYLERAQYNQIRKADHLKDEEIQNLNDKLTKYYDSHTKLKTDFDSMVDMCTELSASAETWKASLKDANTSASVILKNKMDNIANILTDGGYNDPAHLSYTGSKWTMNLLKEKAIHLGIPELYWGSRTSLAYVLRAIEQLKRIEKIVEPVYPDGYETEEMHETVDDEPVLDDETSSDEEEHESKYSDDEDDEDEDDDEDENDPDWIPCENNAGDSDDDDSDDIEYARELISCMTKLAETSAKSRFFETTRSKHLEKLIRLNGLECKYSSTPTPGYTVSGFSRVHQVE